MTFTQPLCLSPKGCTMCVCVCVCVFVCVCVGIFLSTIISIPLMVVRVRKKASYVVYSPFPHLCVFSLFLHSFIPLFFFSLLVFKASFILHKFDQLIDHLIYISSCVQHVCSLNLQPESWSTKTWAEIQPDLELIIRIAVDKPSNIM